MNITSVTTMWKEIVPTDKDEFSELRHMEMKQKANDLMESALELLDANDDCLAAAQLAQAIHTLGIREEDEGA